MGQADRILRQLANLFQAELVGALLPEQRVQVLGRVPARLLLRGLERQADHAVRARIDGVETIAHIELQTEHRRILPVRMLIYNGLFRYPSHPLPVRSIVVYLMHTRRAGVPRGIAEAGRQRRPAGTHNSCPNLLCCSVQATTA